MLSTGEAHQRLQDLDFSQRLVTQALSAQHIPKFQTPRRKTSVQHKAHCLCQQFSRHCELLLSGNSYLYMPTKGQPCKQIFSLLFYNWKWERVSDKVSFLFSRKNKFSYRSYLNHGIRLSFMLIENQCFPTGDGLRKRAQGSVRHTSSAYVNFRQLLEFQHPNIISK